MTRHNTPTTGKSSKTYKYDENDYELRQCQYEKSSRGNYSPICQKQYGMRDRLRNCEKEVWE